MKKNICKIGKNKYKTYRFVIVLIIMFFLCCISFSSIVIANSFIPAAPSGKTSGFANVDYEYTIYTSNLKCSWMFDWGDGTFSNWLNLQGSDTTISQVHSWGSAGDYEVRIKQRDGYFSEGPWSPSLIVTLLSDLDFDGWIDELELSYGTNSSDPNDFPLDTDGDGVPDESSLDELYIGDSDDDNDNINDTIEGMLGSDSKNGLDVKKILIGGITHYLIDTTSDGKSNLFYNMRSGSSTTLELNEEDMYLIDFNGDGKWNYIYDQATGSIYTYKEKMWYELPLWLWVIIGIIIAIVVIILILIKTGILYLYEEEIVVDE